MRSSAGDDWSALIEARYPDVIIYRVRAGAEELKALGALATVERSSGVLEADVAWVIRPQNPGRGPATEAASGVIEWPSTGGVVRYVAYIHPDHAASSRVAVKIGTHRTPLTYDGEIRWESNR